VMLDPTWAPLSRLDWSNAEAEQHYVIGTPTGEELSVTPPLKPEDNVLRVTVDSTLNSSGTMTGRVKIAGTGYMETSLRRWFGFSPGYMWKENLEQMVRAISRGAELTATSLPHGTIEQLDKNFVFSFSFMHSGASATTEPAWTLAPASFKLFVNDRKATENLVSGKLSTRKRGLSFRCAKEVRYDENIKLPGRYELSGWEDISVTNRLGSVVAKVESKGKRLAISLVLRFATRSVPLDQLSEYEELMAAVKRCRTSVLLLKRREK